MSVVFVQPSGINAQGGSSKIFRSLLAPAPVKVQILVYGTNAPPAGRVGVEERFVSERPALGRLEHTRLHFLADLLRVPFRGLAKERFYRTLNAWAPSHVHAHIHGTGFLHASEWCRNKGVPFSISVHDDIRHLTSADLWRGRIEKAAAWAWQNATNRFVISPEIGEEYSRRYGTRSWIQVTDGLEVFDPVSRLVAPHRLNIYFAGAMNVPYEPNFIALQRALKLWAVKHPGYEVRLIARGGRSLRNEVDEAPAIEVRPFAQPDEVRKDLEEADLLYLPLSLDPKYSNFARFSLSTKMITYLAAGLPILYHGPQDAAAYRLLTTHDACLSCFTNEPTDIMQSFEASEERKRRVVQNALDLGREKFRLQEIRQRFWSSILRTAGPHN